MHSLRFYAHKYMAQDGIGGTSNNSQDGGSVDRVARVIVSQIKGNVEERDVVAAIVRVVGNPASFPQLTSGDLAILSDPNNADMLYKRVKMLSGGGQPTPVEEILEVPKSITKEEIEKTKHKNELKDLKDDKKGVEEILEDPKSDQKNPNQSNEENSDEETVGQKAFSTPDQPPEADPNETQQVAKEDKKIVPDSKLNDIHHQEVEDADIRDQHEGRNALAKNPEPPNPHPAENASEGEAVEDKPMVPSSEHDDVTGKGKSASGNSLGQIGTSKDIDPKSLQPAESGTSQQSANSLNPIQNAVNQGLNPTQNLDPSGTSGIDQPPISNGIQFPTLPNQTSPKQELSDLAPNKNDLSEPKDLKPLDQNVVTNPNSPLPPQTPSDIAKRKAERLEDLVRRRDNKDELAEFDSRLLNKPELNKNSLKNATDSVIQSKQALALRKDALNQDYGDGTQGAKQKAEQAKQQAFQQLKDKAYKKAMETGARMASAAGDIAGAALKPVVTAIVSALPEIIGVILIITLIMSIFATIVIYSYCKPIEKVRAVFEYALTGDVKNLAEFADLIPLVGGVVGGAVSGIAQQSELRKYLEADVCKTINPDFCGGSGGGAGATKGDGSVDVGNGIDGIPCLVIERSGKYADPHLRAFARAVGSCGIEAPCGTIQQHYGEANSIGYFGRYQWGVGQGTPDSWQDYVSSSGNSGQVPNATKMYNDSKNGSRTAWRAQDKVFMDCVSGNGGFKCPFGGMLDALKSGDYGKAQSIMRANINNWEAMGTKSDQIVERYKKLLPEEQSGTCGKGTQDIPKNASNTFDIKKFAQLNPLNFGSVEVEAASSITSLTGQQRRDLLLQLHDQGKWNMQNRSERSYWQSSGPQNKVDLMLAIIHPSLGNTWIETGSDSWVHGSHADGTAVDIVRIGDPGKGDPGESGFLSASDKGPYRQTQSMDARILRLVTIAAGTGVVKQGALYGPEVLTQKSEYQGKMWWYPGHNDHIHISVVGDSVKTANIDGVTVSGDANSSGSAGGCAGECSESTPKTSKSENQTNSFASLINGVNVEAFGVNPGLDYSTLPQGHKDFLIKIAQQKNYTAYSDAGKESADMRKAFDAMKSQASKSGFSLVVGGSGRAYRPISGSNGQMATYFSSLSKFWSDGLSASDLSVVEAAYLKRAELSAPPGFSEHSTGLAIDISDTSRSSSDNLDPNSYPTDLTSWLEANAPKFGFKLSYPKGSTTGAGYEPWHWRFEGNSQYPNSTPISQFQDGGAAANPNCENSDNSATTSSDGFIHPMKGKGSVTNCFGQNSCSGHGGRFHKGVDISTGNGEKGAPIYAVADGVVIYSNNECISGVDQVGNSCGGGYGNRTEIEHTVKGQKWLSASNHQYQGSVTVKAGDKVKQGQQIGIEGSSGSSSAQHIHFELSQGSNFVDPCTKFKC
jgi:murein DD-endopeptidase MepM/ murein hydrolase activator NlpD